MMLAALIMVDLGQPYREAPAVHSSRKGEELPMSEDTLRGWFWIAVVVLALVLWIIPYSLRAFL